MPRAETSTFPWSSSDPSPTDNSKEYSRNLLHRTLSLALLALTASAQVEAAKSIDADAYMIRFTPRQKSSIWSKVNLKRVQELIDEGLMDPAGMATFEARDVNKSNRYSFEREHVELDPPHLKLFRANKRAWAFFQRQPPSYRKLAM